MTCTIWRRERNKMRKRGRRDLILFWPEVEEEPSERELSGRLTSCSTDRGNVTEKRIGTLRKRIEEIGREKVTPATFLCGGEGERRWR